MLCGAVLDKRDDLGVHGVVVAGVQAVPGVLVDGEHGSVDESGGLAAGEMPSAEARSVSAALLVAVPAVSVSG